MNELRALRRAADLSQRQLADLRDIPLNTFRMWDSGLRRPPAHIVTRTRDTLAAEARRHELLPLAELARKLGVLEPAIPALGQHCGITHSLTADHFSPPGCPATMQLCPESRPSFGTSGRRLQRPSALWWC